MSISPDEFKKYRINWDEPTSRLLDERMRNSFALQEPVNLTIEETGLLKSLLSRLIPQEEMVDLVGFIDRYLNHPLGRGDSIEGMPPKGEIIRTGLRGIEETASEMHNTGFKSLTDEKKDEIISAVIGGRAHGVSWEKVPGPLFMKTLMRNALTGYCSHPRVWMRMGFPGPSYPEGYIWLDPGGVNSRRKHTPGWETF